MLNSTTLKVGQKLLLAYNHKGKTVPPDRIVVVNYIDNEKFTYDILMLWVSAEKLNKKEGAFILKDDVKKLGINFKQGRAIYHHDFMINMATKSELL